MRAVVRPRSLVAGSCLAAVLFGIAAPAVARPRYAWSVRPLSPAQRAAARGVSWHAGCPVDLAQLRAVRVRHWTFADGVATGTLLVGVSNAKLVAAAFGSIYRSGYRIRRMLPVDAYGGSDYRSIEADNTSAFNCRNATGSSSWSNHAYGLAIDLNPIENPYETDGTSSHPASAPYLVRSRRRRGMVHHGDAVWRAFAAIGWHWGGDASGSIRDYQHFSPTGG